MTTASHITGRRAYEASAVENSALPLVCVFGIMCCMYVGKKMDETHRVDGANNQMTQVKMHLSRLHGELASVRNYAALLDQRIKKNVVETGWTKDFAPIAPPQGLTAANGDGGGGIPATW